MKEIISQFISEVNARNQNEPEFMQAVTEVAENVIPYIVKHDIYYGQNILLRIAEPRELFHLGLLGLMIKKKYKSIEVIELK